MQIEEPVSGGSIIKPRLWIVCEVYYPEMISTGYYLTAIAEGLADEFDVKVICGQPNYAGRGTVAPRHETRNGVEIFRVWSTTLDKNRIPNRVVNMLTIGASTFLRELRGFRAGDRVLVVTAPPNLPFITAPAALAKGANYVPLLHDVYPEQLIAVGSTKPGSLLVRGLNVFNRWLLKHASKVIVVGRDMKELIETKAAGLDPKVEVIPNWADLELVKPIPRDEDPMLDELGIRDKFVFMYAGNIGRPTEIETIIDCAESYLDDDRFHFVFVGGGAKRPWLEKEVTGRELRNVTIAGTRPREEQSIFLNACDVSIVTLVKGMWGAAMPSRTYNCLAAGKPILGLIDEGAELARVIEEEQVGWHTPPGNVDAMREIVERFFTERDNLSEMSERARDAALKKYSPQTAIEAYRRVLRP